MLDQPLEWLYWTGLHVTGWKLIGYTGALMFGARWLVQFVASRRAAGLAVLARPERRRRGADRLHRRAHVRRPLAGPVRRIPPRRPAGDPAPVLVHERGRQPDDPQLLPVLAQAGLGRGPAEHLPGLHRAVQPAPGHPPPWLAGRQGAAVGGGRGGWKGVRVTFPRA